MSTLQIQYPPDIRDALKGRNVLPMAPGDRPWECPNCGGQGVMTAYRIDAGPFKTPPARGSKYLTINGQAGWWKGELLVGHCPACSAGRMGEYLRTICGLEGSELEISLETFKTTGPLAPKAEALQMVRGIMAMNRTPSGFVTLLGDHETSHGVGKSHLAKAMVNGFRQVGVPSRYTTLADLLAELHAKFGRGQTVSTDELLEQYRRIRVLAIDELDKTELTGWDKQTVFRLIDARHRQQTELLTILIANAFTKEQQLWLWTPNQWGKQIPDPWPAELGYLQSRILGGLVITVPGPDYRKMQGFTRMQEALETEADEED